MQKLKVIFVAICHSIFFHFAEDASAAQLIVVPAVELENGYRDAPTMGTQELSTEYAEAAMSPSQGRKTVMFGAILILLFLFLTEWKIRGNQPTGSLEEKVQRAQVIMANAINKPIAEINRSLESEGKAISARLIIFISALVSVLWGAAEILTSAMRRRRQKNLFPALRRARALKFTSFLVLAIAILAGLGIGIGWRRVGDSVYL